MILVSIDVLAFIMTKILIISLMIYIILSFLKRIFSEVNVDPKGNAILITGKCKSYQVLS